MQKIILTESQVKKLIMSEQSHERYMFFQNLKQIERQSHYILSKIDESTVEEMLNNGHDWADDHITEAKSLMDQVFDFIMNEVKGHHHGEGEPNEEPVNADVNQFSLNENEEIDEAKHKPTNAALWSRAKSMAKSKFKVYPSAYANGWAAKWYKNHGGGWKTTK
jgi:hypothetical protein